MSLLLRTLQGSLLPLEKSPTLQPSHTRPSPDPHLSPRALMLWESGPTPHLGLPESPECPGGRIWGPLLGLRGRLMLKYTTRAQ